MASPLTTSVSKKIGECTGNLKIPQKTLQQIQDKLYLHHYYKGRILRGIKTDEILVQQINDEI